MKTTTTETSINVSVYFKYCLRCQYSLHSTDEETEVL